MQGYNIIMVYNPTADKILMCKREKDPYKGLFNLVGGKIDSGEEGLAAAYRELNEETGIGKDDIELKHLMDFKYYYQKCYVEVYVGRLKHEVEVKGDERQLLWLDFSHNFFDMSIFAGEGNIGHMVEQVNLYWSSLLQ